MGEARDLIVFTQTNISTEYLVDPNLSLPFTSFLYISQGENATGDPPTTIRIAQIDGTNSSTGNGRPTLLIMEHLPGFYPPEAINAPSGLAWHASNIGTLNNLTLVSNHALMRTWGTGLVADLWEIIAKADHFHYVPGESDENKFIKEFIEKLGMGNTPAARAYAAQVERAEYRMRAGMPRVQQLLDDARASMTGTNIRMIDANTGEISDFDFQRPTEVTIDGQRYPSYKGLTYSKSIQTDILSRISIRSPHPHVPESLQPTDSIMSWRGSQPIPGTEGRGISAPCGRRLRRRQACTMKAPTLETEVAMLRKGGKFLTMSLIDGTAAWVLNEMVRLAAISFVIVDFIDGYYLGGALGAIGVAAASLIPLIMGGPLGILFGTGLAFLFFILPGVFEMAPIPPSIANNTEIIQFAFFGDKDHTGNEKCAQEHPGCIASYGPGILALTFKWEFFDAVAFLIWANRGFPITIPDLAQAFDKAISLDKDQNMTAVAGITCGNYIGSHIVHNRWGTTSWSGTNPNQCTSAKFHFNRTLVTLPNINRTAAEVYDEIIGAPQDGGSCKIINNADNMVTIPNYGIRLKGLPVAIACGINGTVPGDNINGTVLANIGGNGIAPGPNAVKAPSISSNQTASGTLSGESLATSIQPASTTNPNQSEITSITSSVAAASSNSPGFLTLNAPTGVPTGSNPGSLSTDGRTGEGYIPPPPPAPFQPSLTPENSACFTSSNLPNYFCLPNGTYTSQTGTFNFYHSKVTGAYFPPGSSLIIHSQFPSLFYPTKSTQTYTSNVTSKNNNGFHRNMEYVLSFDVIILAPAPPPVACLFTLVKYAGDVTCVGVGGGNMTAGAGKVSSVAIYGDATVTLYPNAYGDPGSQTFTVSVEDLATVPYGTNNNMKGNVSAVLVQAPTNGVATD